MVSQLIERGIPQPITPKGVADFLLDERRSKALKEACREEEMRERLRRKQEHYAALKTSPKTLGGARSVGKSHREHHINLKTLRKISALTVNLEREKVKVHSVATANLEWRIKEHTKEISAARRETKKATREAKKATADKMAALKALSAAEKRLEYTLGIAARKSNVISLRTVQVCRLTYWEGIYLQCLKDVIDAGFASRHFQLFQDRVENGTSPLEFDDLKPYIASYGAHHYHKLWAAFEGGAFNNLSGRRLEIIDWGCGQAIATCILIDYFLEKRIFPEITRITLVEPSLSALERGVCYLEEMLIGGGDVKGCINQVNARINSLKDDQVKMYSGDSKLHLFFNILDVPDINLSALVDRICQRSQGYNRFICIGPDNQNADRLEKFRELLAERCSLTNERFVKDALIRNVYMFRNGSLAQQPISRYERQFTVLL